MVTSLTCCEKNIVQVTLVYAFDFETFFLGLRNYNAKTCFSIDLASYVSTNEVGCLFKQQKSNKHMLSDWFSTAFRTSRKCSR